MQISVKWQTDGREAGLCSDISPKEITESRLFLTDPETGALNVRNVGSGTNLSPDYELIKGNVYIYTPDVVATQNKVFRIFLETSPVINTFRKLSIFDGNGRPLTTLSDIKWNIYTTISQVYLNAVAAINGAIFAVPQSFAIGAFVQTSTTAGYFDFSITTIPTWEYSLLVSLGTSSTKQPIVLQESIDVSMLGEWRDTGNNDQLGDEFHFWTTRLDNPTLVITGAQNNGSGAIRIGTSTPHNLVNNQAVNISSVGGVPNADGIWIITIIDATHFDLMGSIMNGGYTSGGVVVTKPYGLGEIGVGVKDEAAQSWTYTRLLRSKKLNFSVQYPIDCRFKRKNDGNIAGYFCQGNNNPRVIYYKGAYVTDGALSINGGIYEYDSVSDELKLIISSGGGAGFGITVDAAAQIQSGGQVASGNWCYAADFLTDKLSESGYTELTNPIPVFKSNIAGVATAIGGDASLTITGKKNVLVINTPVEDFFKYVRIAAVNYLSDGSFQGVVIGTYLLTGTQTTIVHTGTEVNVTDLDLGTLNTASANIDTALNVELSQNRAILSNLTVAADRDFTPFTKTGKHSIKRQGLPVVGVPYTPPLVYKLGEYADPANVYSKTGYMHNEIYRFAARLRTKSGFITSAYWVDDVRIDTLPTNAIANPADPTRRISGLPDYDLTNNIAADTAYAAYLEFSGFDVDMLIDGIPVRELIDEIIIVRVDISKDENLRDVLGTGIIVKAVQPSQTLIKWYEPYYNPDVFQFFINGSTLVAGYVNMVEYYAATGFVGWTDLLGVAAVETYTSDTGGGTPLKVDKPQWAAFYCSDILFGNSSFQRLAGDVVFNFGIPYSYILSQVSTIGTTAIVNSEYAEYNGSTGVNGTTKPYQTAKINNTFNAPFGTVVVRDDVDKFAFHRQLQIARFNGSTYPYNAIYDHLYCYLLKTEVTDQFAALNYNSNIDRGVQYVQYIRPRAGSLDNGKYGDRANSKYIPTGASYIITGATPTLTPAMAVFGGDVFTQKTYIRNRIPSTPSNTSGGGCGMGFYSQNRVNAQLHQNYNTSFIDWQYPNVTSRLWLEGITSSSPTVNYNSGYNINNAINIYNGFDVNSEHQLDWGNAFIWSDPESDGTVTDQLRRFPPLNIKFMDYTNGSITDLRELNSEIIVIQPNYTEREFYNTTNVVTSTEGQEVILGQSGVFARRGTDLSKFGSAVKGSIVIGYSDKGQQNLYMWDLINLAIIRVGYDGSNSLDEIHGIKSFIANNTRYLIGKNNLGAGEGIGAVANQRYREVIWTVRGLKEDGSIGNNYTLVWSELKNVFQAFHSPKPKRYAKYKNTFLSILDSGRVYEHDRGERGKWYDDTLISGGFYEACVNAPKDAIKWLIALRYYSLRAPDRVDITTEQNKTFMLSNDFKKRENNFNAAVRNDTTQTGNNNDRTSRVYGDFAIVKTHIYPNGLAQKIGNFFLKIRVGSRTNKQ